MSNARVRVSVPATSANLGPGFDALGLALDLRDEVEVSLTDAPPEDLLVEVAGEGADGVPRDESHLVVRALRRGLDALGAAPAGLRLSCRNAVPHARGLGSSAAAIVAGLVAARALVRDGDERLDDAALLALAVEMEGHPDNVAPALLGGFTVAVTGEARGGEEPTTDVARLQPHPDVRAVALVPADGVSTETARGLLPDVVPHRDAAANAGRAALLVAALTVEPSLLHAATADLLHQRYRRPAMPASLDLVERLRGLGVAAVVSGAGPTVLALVADDATEHRAAAHRPDGWRAHHLAPDDRGAMLLGTGPDTS